MSTSMDNLGRAFEQGQVLVEEHPWQAASNWMDNLTQAFEQARTYVEEHPWQAAALAAYPIGGGAAYAAGQLAKKEAAPLQ